VLRWLGTRFDQQVKVSVGEVEEQSVLAAEQARRAKDRLTKEFRKGCSSQKNWRIQFMK
jgi:hypothetical protein